MRIAASALVLAALLSGPAAAAPRVIDGFESSAPWSPVPASGVLMKLATERGERGNALRVDFDFQKGGGYAVLRRTLDLPLPSNYRFALRVRGACTPQNFEFKLIDASGENVWWTNRRDFAFPTGWQTVATRKRQIEFAWGPIGGGEMKRVVAIEFAITAGSGGKGTVWLDELTFEELPPPSETPPPIVARASSSRPDRVPARAVDGDSATGWQPAAAAGAWLELDLGVVREFGGLTLDWDPVARATDYDVRVATEPGRFRTVRAVRGGGGTRDWLYLPDTEARWVRIGRASGTAAVALREVTLQPLAFGSSMNKFYEAIAKASPRGHYPRSILGEQQFWTVVGTPGGREESFLSQDGAADIGTGRPSIEPFLWVENRLWTWADVTTEQSLAPDPLPMPRVEWKGAPVELRVDAMAAEETEQRVRSRLVIADSSAAGADAHVRLQLRYRIFNSSKERRRGSLFLAVRPFQVNPPSQFLNTQGGVSGVRSIRRGRDVFDGYLDPIVLDDSVEFTFSQPLTDLFGVVPFDAGDITKYLSRGELPKPQSVIDSVGLASAAIEFPFDLAPGDSMVASVRSYPNRLIGARGAQNPYYLSAPSADSVATLWRSQLGPARVSLPPSAREVERSLVAQLGWIAINRDGPAIQPGSRAYARSWIRDGALTSSALLRWGRSNEVKAFLEWFAPFQYADGKVPCCVDKRGSDPVPEHDSHGEFIYLAAEYLRHTGDTATVRKLWPNVARAAAYLDTLRAQRRTPEWRAPEKREFFGILPPSISHEGYSAKPMHSYWDDFWAVRGYADAAYLARLVGTPEEARRFAASGAEFRADFAASIAAARVKHAIDYVPGCADMGDFDATSTTIALDPVQGANLAPAGAIEATFERYWKNFENRRDGRETWEAFTPYEIRNIGAFVRLGWRGRAHELLDWFLDQRSPAGWAQWAEVVWNRPASAKFLGDIPHTWVGSDFVRSVLDMFAYEREADEALVLAAGVSEAWAREATGVNVAGIDTWHGPLTYSLKGEGRGLRLEIDRGLRVPRGGLVVAAPGVTPRWRATVNGRPASVNARGEVVVRSLPATVRLSP